MRLPNLPERRLFLACGVAALLTPLAFADDKKEGKAPTGTWKQKDGESVIEFVDKDVLKLLPHGDKADIAIECSYSVGKDGVVKVKVTGHAGKDEFKKKLEAAVPLKSEFRFKWTADGDTASIDEFEGKDLEGVKSRIEGKYEKK